MPDAPALPAALTIDVVSDVVCPWCYVGQKRLQQALALREELDVVVRWRPFQLDATIPAEGLDRVEYMAKKFGSMDRIAPVHERLTEMGRELGIAFAFDAIKKSPNTLDAHRLIRWAAAFGSQGAVVSGLFEGYFSRGLDLGDVAVLADIAGDAGLDREAASVFLVSGALAEEVRKEIGMAQELGIQGVPFFIFGGTHAVSGAEAAEVLAGAIDQAVGAA